MTPLRPSRTTIGKRTRERPDREVEVAARVAKGPDQERRDEDEERGEATEDEEDEPEDRRRDPPGALAFTLLEQIAEDLEEGARERRVGEQCTYEVGDLEGDRERVDCATDPEVVGGDHLTHEPEDAGETRCDREEQGRTGEPPVLGGTRRGRSGGIGGVTHAGRVRRGHALHLRTNRPRSRRWPSLDGTLRPSAPPASCGHSYARG